MSGQGRRHPNVHLPTLASACRWRTSCGGRGPITAIATEERECSATGGALQLVGTTIGGIRNVSWFFPDGAARRLGASCHSGVSSTELRRFIEMNNREWSRLANCSVPRLSRRWSSRSLMRTAHVKEGAEERVNVDEKMRSPPLVHEDLYSVCDAAYIGEPEEVWRVMYDKYRKTRFELRVASSNGGRTRAHWSLMGGRLMA